MKLQLVLATAVAVASTAVGAAPAVAAAGSTAAPANIWNNVEGSAGNDGTNAGETALTPASAQHVAARWDRPTGSLEDRPLTVVGGVGYTVDDNGAPYFAALSAATGATLWTVPLPTDGEYLLGVSVFGHIAVMSFDGHNFPGGITAVDLNTHRLLYSRYQPDPTPPRPGQGNGTVGTLFTDGQRVYLFGGSNPVNTFRLSDGGLLWSAPSTLTGVGGAAYGYNSVFVSNDNGLTAYSATTGAREWNVPGAGGSTTVVAGNKVITSVYGQVRAVSATGCGHTTCSTVWRTALPDTRYDPMVSGVDATTGFLTSTSTADTPTGTITRFNVATGAIQWSATIPPFPGPVARAASTVWVEAGNNDISLSAFATTATSTRPLMTIPVPGSASGQALSVAAGRVLVTNFPNDVHAYAPPGS